MTEDLASARHHMSTDIVKHGQEPVMLAVNYVLFSRTDKICVAGEAPQHGVVTASNITVNSRGRFNRTRSVLLVIWHFCIIGDSLRAVAARDAEP